MSAPRVGITADWVERDGRLWATLDRQYTDWLARAGFRSEILPAEPGREERALQGLQALVLSGGGDLLPEFYAGNPVALPEERFSHRDRSAFEIALAWRATRLGLPVLGICLGCQTLNVAFGGDLVRHLHDPHSRHRRPAPGRSNPRHRLRAVPGTRVAAFDPTPDTRVCSSHHQAIARVAPGWRVSAWGPGEVVEAIECPSFPNVLGVQWHPERTPHSPLSEKLARWFLDAARARRPEP